MFLREYPVTDIAVSFGSLEREKLAKYQDRITRELFYYLVNVDEFADVLPRASQFVEEHLSQAEKCEKAQKVPELLCFFTYSEENFRQRLKQWIQWQESANNPDIPQFSREQHLYMLWQQAPMALLDGCWLQNTSLTATCHTEVATLLFQLYTKKIGDGQTREHYGNLYRDLLHSAGIYMPEISSWAFVTQPEIADSAFTKAVFGLAISQFPRSFWPEIIGFNLGHYFASFDRLHSDLITDLQHYRWHSRYFELYQREALQESATTASKAVELYLTAIGDQYGAQAVAEHWRRIWNSVVVHYTTTRVWHQEIAEHLEAPKAFSPRQKMVALVRRKAPYARGMHKYSRIGDKFLNEWFAEDNFDVEKFLDELACSPFIDRKEPRNSKFFTQLVAFGGPMFRVFTEDEIAAILAWVESLGEEDATTPAVYRERQQSAPVNTSSPDSQFDFTTADEKKYARANKRELFYYFVNIDLFPDVLPAARETAHKYFAKTQVALRRNKGLPGNWRLFPYSHEAFERRVMTIYEQQVASYRDFTEPMTTRESMIWALQQFAPFALVDGCWLQTIARAGVSQTEVSARLFHIYADEIGNANTTYNHPNVYRKLLESLEIDMPRTDSWEFCQQPIFQEQAFDIPLLLLSASLFPKTFLPEIIGINLGIELSGLGGEYMTMIDEMNHWGMDSYFFTLHLTIDNMSTGHASVAMEIVELYLDHILATCGQDVVQQHWQRIWGGYVAFKKTEKAVLAALNLKALVKFIIPRWWRSVKARFGV